MKYNKTTIRNYKQKTETRKYEQTKRSEEVYMLLADDEIEQRPPMAVCGTCGSPANQIAPFGHLYPSLTHLSPPHSVCTVVDGTTGNEPQTTTIRSIRDQFSGPNFIHFP